MDNLLLAIQRTNELKQAVFTQIEHNNYAQFKIALDRLCNSDNKSSNKTDKEKQIDIIKARIDCFLTILRDEKPYVEQAINVFKEENLIEKEFLLLGLHAFNQEQLVKKLLTQDLYTITPKTYEGFFNIFEYIIDIHNRPGAPYGRELKEEMLETQKRNFFEQMAKYAFKFQLESELPLKNEVVSKKIKI